MVDTLQFYFIAWFSWRNSRDAIPVIYGKFLYRLHEFLEHFLARSPIHMCAQMHIWIPLFGKRKKGTGSLCAVTHSMQEQFILPQHSSQSLIEMALNHEMLTQNKWIPGNLENDWILPQLYMC